MRRVTFITTCAIALCASPAYGAGGPVPPVQGGVGVSVPGGGDNFITVAAGDRTVVMRVRRSDASVQRSRSLAGSFGVPGVTYDGVNTGLSADGGTLVLSAGMSRYPPRETSLRVLDARRLRTRGEPIVLPGFLTVDAISPDGRWLYLVDYKDGGATQYDVRAYDLKTRRLQAGTIVDPREPDEKLQGIPITRVQSPDGRWAYTLYTGDEPFIHALDTEGRTAVCIDVPQLSGEDGGAGRLRLSADGLEVASEAGPVALVDLKTFAVSAPRPAPEATATATPAAATRPATSSSDIGPPWALWTLPLVGFGVLVVAARRRRSAAR